MGTITGPLAELDFYTDCQFICVALEFGSRLAYVSIVIFFVSNICLQLIFTTLAATDRDKDALNSLFKVRGFDVLHEVAVCASTEFGISGNERGKLFALFLMGKFLFEDVLQ